MDFKSYWPSKKVTVPNFVWHEYTFILIKTGTLYNKIYLDIKIDMAAEMTFLTNNQKRVFAVL